MCFLSDRLEYFTTQKIYALRCSKSVVDCTLDPKSRKATWMPQTKYKDAGYLPAEDSIMAVPEPEPESSTAGGASGSEDQGGSGDEAEGGSSDIGEGGNNVAGQGEAAGGDEAGKSSPRRANKWSPGKRKRSADGNGQNDDAPPSRRSRETDRHTGQLADTLRSDLKELVSTTLSELEKAGYAKLSQLSGKSFWTQLENCAVSLLTAARNDMYTRDVALERVKSFYAEARVKVVRLMVAIKEMVGIATT